MLESELESIFVRKLQGMGCISKKLSMHYGRGDAGWPDRMVLVPGAYVYFVELKREGGVLTPKQTRAQTILRLLGHHVVTLYGLADVEAWLHLVKVRHHL